MKFISIFLVLLFTMSTWAAVDHHDLMSFNVRYGLAKDGEHHWDKRKSLVVETIKANNPDIIGLQEALLFQVEYIKKQLPAYDMAGEGRDGGHKGEYTAILYKKNKFKLEETETFWLSDTPEQPSKHWGNRYLRICTWAKFRNLKNEREFFVYNTHLDHESQQAREKSATLLKQRIAERKSTAPFVLMGDFNTEESSATIKYLINDDSPAHTLMSDSFREINPTAKTVGTYNGFKGLKDGKRIDYIFTSLGLKVSDASIIYEQTPGKYPSDHYAVTTRISFKPSRGLRASSN